MVGVSSVAAEEIVCQTTAGDIEDGLFGPCAKNKKARFKKSARRLCRKLHRGQTGDRKRSSFNHAQYHPTTNQDIQAPSIEPILSAHQGHSPTKAEVKKLNRLLLDENQHLKKEFHKAERCLKTLLSDKNNLQRRLRLESKTSNNLIKSIHDEAKDMMKRAQDILSEANRSKKEAELIKDEIKISRNALQDERTDLRKKSARLKKQAARMTVTHARRKRALSQKQKKSNIMSIPKSNGGMRLFNWQRRRCGVHSNSHRKSA